MLIPYNLLDSYSMFAIYAFIGWIVEVIYYGITEGKFINRGFLNGPLCPVYGIGFYAVIIMLLPFEDNLPILFFGSMAVTTLIEFLAGAILYKIFDLRWWDYSNYKLNVKGFICMQFSIYWGIACTLAIKILHPTVLFILDWIPDIAQLVLMGIFTVCLIADLITTVVTIVGFKKKLLVLSDLTSEIRNMSDKIGSQIYGGVETVMTKTAPAVEGYGGYKELYAAHRAEERELMKKNRQIEKEYLEKYLSREKEQLKISRKSADEMVNRITAKLKKNEEHLLSRIVASKDDANRMVLNLLKRKEEEKGNEEEDEAV